MFFLERNSKKQNIWDVLYEASYKPLNDCMILVENFQDKDKKDEFMRCLFAVNVPMCKRFTTTIFAQFWKIDSFSKLRDV